MTKSENRMTNQTRNPNDERRKTARDEGILRLRCAPFRVNGDRGQRPRLERPRAVLSVLCVLCGENLPLHRRAGEQRCGVRLAADGEEAVAGADEEAAGGDGDGGAALFPAEVGAVENLEIGGGEDDDFAVLADAVDFAVGDGGRGLKDGGVIDALALEDLAAGGTLPCKVKPKAGDRGVAGLSLPPLSPPATRARPPMLDFPGGPALHLADSHDQDALFSHAKGHRSDEDPRSRGRGRRRQ